MTLKERVRCIPVTQIKPYHDIRRYEFLAALTEDMRKSGWKGRPLVAARTQQEGLLWAYTGSHRYRAAVDAGLAEIPVVVMTPEEAAIAVEEGPYQDEIGMAMYRRGEKAMGELILMDFMVDLLWDRDIARDPWEPDAIAFFVTEGVHPDTAELMAVKFWDCKGPRGV
jgi:hypothetical protein